MVKNPTIGVGVIPLINEGTESYVRFIVCKTKDGSYCVQACDYPLIVANRRFHICISGFLTAIKNDRASFSNSKTEKLTRKVRKYFNGLGDDWESSNPSITHTGEDAMRIMLGMVHLTYREFRLKQLCYNLIQGLKENPTLCKDLREVISAAGKTLKPSDLNKLLEEVIERFNRTQKGDSYESLVRQFTTDIEGLRFVEDPDFLGVSTGQIKFKLKEDYINE